MYHCCRQGCNFLLRTTCVCNFIFISFIITPLREGARKIICVRLPSAPHQGYNKLTLAWDSGHFQDSSCRSHYPHDVCHSKDCWYAIATYVAGILVDVRKNIPMHFQHAKRLYVWAGPRLGERRHRAWNPNHIWWSSSAHFAAFYKLAQVCYKLEILESLHGGETPELKALG